MKDSVFDALISSLVDNLVSSVISLVSTLRIFEGRENQVVEEINGWKTILEDLRCFLQDAEDKKQDNPVVRRWVEDLEELTYDAEDVIEDFNYETTWHQRERQEPSSGYFSLGKIWNFVKRRRTCWPNSEMTGKLDKITQKLRSLKVRKSELNLLQLPVTRTARLGWSRDPSVSLPSEPVVLGREEDKQTIIDILMSQREGEPRVGVVPIVGMGGIGKTTLARYVFNDLQVVNCFNLRAWVCVSADYDTKKISKEILESVFGNHGDVKDKSLEWIQGMLGEVLRNKKFLLVLDDNWNDDYADWHVLRPPFLEGSIGSKIIVTTRSQKVADTVRTTDCIFPCQLSDEDCWSLLYIHAGLDPNGNSFSRLEPLGKKIAKKCSGLPLAAMSVGGLLRNKLRVDQWEKILNSRFWVSKDGHLDVMSVLMMSYNDLDSQLKRCFSFLSLFPEDYKFNGDEVVQLWVGAGLIQLRVDEQSKKETGHECFRELLARSLLSERRDSLFPYYAMHDLVRDVAKEVYKKNLYISRDDKMDGLFKNTRNLSFHGSRFEEIVSCIVKDKKADLPLRSFLALEVQSIETGLDGVFGRLNYVRVLHLTKLSRELPECIGQLRLLRYLNVSESRFQRLPSSITSLYNVEILILKNCCMLEQLPEKIGKFINLLYLDITGCNGLNELPEEIKELRKLGHLSNFIVGEKSPVSSLGNLKLLQGRLEISSLQKVTSCEDARLAKLSDKKLENLELKWPRGMNQAEMEHAQGILEQLQPHEDLKVLVMQYYDGSTFPHWLTNSIKYLAVLKLENCSKCTSQLKAMPSLEELRVIECPEMTVFLGRIPMLKILHIERCKEVECMEAFSLDSLNVFILSNVDAGRMNPLFKKKIKLGSCHAKSLKLQEYSSIPFIDLKVIPNWTLSDVSLITDDFFEEMKVELLILKEQNSLKHLPLWVYNAKSLKTLEVVSCSELSMLLPYDEFPPSLTELRVKSCKELRSLLSQDKLPQRGSNAVSLRNLEVEGCPSLKILLLHGEFPNCLTNVMISCCQVLESLHSEELPRSIQKLFIVNCPLLTKMCEDRDQRLCSKISHIPCIKLDYKEISLL